MPKLCHKLNHYIHNANRSLKKTSLLALTKPSKSSKSSEYGYSLIAASYSYLPNVSPQAKEAAHRVEAKNANA